MVKIGFYEFLSDTAARTKLEEDFLSDLRGDAEFPANISSWLELELYLESCGATDGAVEAAKSLWVRYKIAN